MLRRNQENGERLNQFGQIAYMEVRSLFVVCFANVPARASAASEEVKVGAPVHQDLGYPIVSRRENLEAFGQAHGRPAYSFLSGGITPWSSRGSA